MTKKRNIWFIIAGALIGLGIILTLIVFVFNNFDFSKLDTSTYLTNQHEINETFENININSDTAIINFVYSKESTCKVECYETSSESHTVIVKDNTLTIQVNKDKKWYDYIGFDFNSPIITIYLPNTEYNSLTISNDTGDINIPKDFTFNNISIDANTADIYCASNCHNLLEILVSTGDVSIENNKANAIKVTTSTGDIELYNVTCQKDILLNVSTGRMLLNKITCETLNSTGNTGKIKLIHVTGIKFVIERTTGDVLFDHSDANDIYVKTDTGDVKGSLLTSKVFICKTDTGDINVPESIEGSKCKIITDTGDIELTVIN
jgi:DUF4097 and DUF4098 domain-containing protein YvlB